MKTGLFFSDFLWVLFYTTLALGGGLVFNQLTDHPLPLVYQSKGERLRESVLRLAPSSKFPSSTQDTEVDRIVPLDQFKPFVEEHQGIILDARPEIFYRLGHIPGAISLPRDSFEEQYKTVRPILEHQPRKLIVVYCSSAECKDSRLVQTSLINLGYPDVAVFLGGWSEWEKSVGTHEKAQ